MKKTSEVELPIYRFLKSEELLFIIQFVKKGLMQADNIYRQDLKNKFSEYFQTDEIDSINGKDIRTILAIMIMHRRFTSRIHLHDTPYYYDLIQVTLDAFLRSKQQPIENFPWAAVIRGNLMRVVKKEDASKYFIMAIRLPIARTLMALTYRSLDLRRMDGSKKLLKMLKNSEQCYLSQFPVYNDFIVSYLKAVENHFRPHLFEFKSKRSRRYELLENNFKYEQIIRDWEEFKKPSPSKDQYIEKWHIQMMEMEMKDPVLASHMAAGLAYLYSKRNMLLKEIEHSLPPYEENHVLGLELARLNRKEIKKLKKLTKNSRNASKKEVLYLALR